MQLSDAEFERLIACPCYYCGRLPYNKTKYRGLLDNFKYTGIIRVRNEGPFSYDNVVPSCKICTSMKSKLSEAEFMEHVQRIALWQASDIY